MYTEKERAKLLIQAATAVSTYPEVEGIVQVGSGVDGFGDQYSDIDLIFSTFSADQLASLRTRWRGCFPTRSTSVQNRCRRASFCMSF